MSRDPKYYSYILIYIETKGPIFSYFETDSNFVY